MQKPIFLKRFYRDELYALTIKHLEEWYSNELPINSMNGRHLFKSYMHNSVSHIFSIKGNTMKESNEINLPRYGRVLGAANAAARQTPGALVRCAENSEAFVNTVRLTVPPEAELNKIAVHYLHNAAFAADKTTLRTGADGVSILFAVDMTQPYLD